MSKVPQGILESLTRYIRENPIRMHMPGHKGMTTRPVQEMPGEVLEAVKALDITEVPGMDNLHYPRGAIRATERALSRAFGTSRTHCLVNGATSGILASLLAIRMTLGKGRIIVPRNAHRSIVSGLVLSGLEPLFVYPEYDASLGGYLPLQVSDIKKQLKGWPSNGRCSLAGRIKDIRGMVLVNPTYFGMARDTSGLCLLAGEMGIPVVADEAHGTLFPFSGRFPPSAIRTGASLVVHGVHKTSKAFTQTGLLHVAQTCTDMFPGLAENVQEALRLVQSTSPSYLLLASLERAMEDFSQDSEWVQTVVESGRGLASRLSRIQGLEVRVPWEGTEPNGDTARPGRDRGFLWDPGKILVGVSALGITGPQAQAILWEKNRVVPEMVGFDYVLLMVTGSDTSSTIERVVRGFEALSNECLGPGATVAALQYSPPLPGEREGCKFFTKTLEQEPPRAKRVMSLSQAFYSNSRPFSLRDSIGKICADTIFIYPPGSPIVVPGERIDDAIVKYLNAAMKCGLEVLGRGIFGLPKGDESILCGAVTSANTGVFISLEGCDGSGKSTQIARVAGRLESMGLNPLITREPGGTPFGERVRELLLDVQSPDRAILSELFLYAAARSEFVSKIVRPALAQGRIIIAERYIDSTWVYQGYAGGISLSSIESINNIATGGLEPDLTLILDIDNPLVLQERFAFKVKDKIESRSEEYHQKVRQGYRELAKRFSHRTVTIDASSDVCQVESSVWREIVNILSKKGYDLVKEGHGRESL